MRWAVSQAMRWQSAALVVLGATIAACGKPMAERSEAPSTSALPPSTGLAAPPVASSSAAPAPSVAWATAPRDCAESTDVRIFVSPQSPTPGRALRVIAISSTPRQGLLQILGANGKPVEQSDTGHGGPPYWWFAEIAAPDATRRVLFRDQQIAVCKDVEVRAERATDPSGVPPARERGERGAWPIRAAWTAETEDLYSAWIEKLFDDPLDRQPSWPALGEVLRDPKRNFLHDHLGLAEDEPRPKVPLLDPDCADLPYFLRAYFAFKIGLPIGYSGCSRGGATTAPRCNKWHSSQDEKIQKKRDQVGAFTHFLRVTLADSVHSGTARSGGEDDSGDFYPVRLSAETLRPGTIFADPYGHVLVVVQRIAQTPTSGGVLLAVDGQPDGTVARRRYWRGNFLFALGPSIGTPGFKRFRPVRVEGSSVRALTNAEIAKEKAYGDWGLDQYAGGVEAFYDTMDDVLSPRPMDPTLALRETIQALEEQVKGRVLSVQNGEKYFAGGGERIDMPDGSEIFETSGPWEDFSTPSRDLRLLIAIDVVRTFPERVARRPNRYALSGSKGADAMKAELETLLQREIAARRFQYVRTDGSSFELSLADVIARARDLEMAYNPNDCVEKRWGAPSGSPELATCRRYAPGDQRRKMAKYRPWFHERRRPPRGS